MAGNGVRSRRRSGHRRALSASDLVLLGLAAVATIAALAAVGALLASALIVVPAATVRLWTRRLLPWQIGSVALTALEGVGGIWLSVGTNAPPGSTIAVISGVVFAIALGGRALRRPLVLRLAGSGAAILALLALTTACGGSPGGSGESTSWRPPPSSATSCGRWW